MASDYDVLLEPPAQSPSEYDALLASEPAPAASPYDVLLSDAQESPRGTLGQAEIAQADEQQEMERTASKSTPQWAENAAVGLTETAKGFVPHSLGDVLGFLTPVKGAIEEIGKAYAAGKEMLTTDASLEEIARNNTPENFMVADALKTPPLSKERFTATFGVLSQLLMAAGLVRGIPGPGAPRPLKGGLKEKLAPVLGEEVAPVPEVAIPESVRPPEAPGVETREPTAETPLRASGELPIEVPATTISEAPREAAAQSELLRPDSEKIAPIEGEVLSGERPVEPQPPEATAEVPPPERAVTAIKNEQVDAERSARGLPEAMEPARRQYGEVWDEAMTAIERDPTVQDRLISELQEAPRALTDKEDALLLHRQIDLQNRFGKTAREFTEAAERGDEVARVETETSLSRIQEDLLTLYNAGKAAGTETARGLAARRMLGAEDFSLASMLVKKRVAKGGEQLTPVETAEVQKLSEKIVQTQAKIDERSEALAKRTGRTPEQLLEARKKRVAARTTELKQKTAAGDFTKLTRREQLMDDELANLLFENSKAKEAFTKGLFSDQLARRSTAQKVLGTGQEILNTSRAVVTSLDLSAVLRQGGFITLGHPVRAAKAFPSMFRALASEKGQFRVNEEIRSRQNAPLYRTSKLYLADETAVSLSKMEEAYMSRWANKIPGVGASQRAYITFLNRLRADSFDAMVKGLTRDGKANPEEARAIANFVNVATGRGELGRYATAATAMNSVLFAPRYVTSRFQLLAGQPLYKGTAATRTMIAKEYARFLAGVAVVYGLAQAAGGEIEADPRSADFGKINFGDTHIDPLSGLSQVSVLTSRLATGETKTASGEIKPIRGDKVPFGSGNSADVVARFLRTKLAPLPGTAIDILAGKNVVGEKVTPASAAQRIVTPLAFSDIYQTMQEQGMEKGTALGVLSIFGMGLQTYEPKEELKIDRSVQR